MGKVKEMLKAGKSVVGPFMKIQSPAIVEIFGYAGFDYVIIDQEHAPLNVETMENMVRAAQLSGMTPIVRIRKNDPTLVSQALDIGAEGVQVPQISTYEHAKELAEAARFYPEGDRGVDCYVRASGYSSTDKQSYFKQSNENNLVIIHVEGTEGVKNLDQIITVKGLDVIFLGPYDLSASLGVPGEIEHPSVIEKMDEVINKVREKDLYMGIYADDVETARKWLDRGIQYVSVSVDVVMMLNASKSVADALVDRGQ